MAAPIRHSGDWKTTDVQEECWNGRRVTKHTQMGS